jgi:hypothetical protein
VVSVGIPWKRVRSRGPFTAEARAERRTWRRERKASAAAVSDTFLDVVVLLSVVMFLALAAGIGMLALQSTGSI